MFLAFGWTPLKSLSDSLKFAFGFARLDLYQIVFLVVGNKNESITMNTHNYISYSQCFVYI